MIAIFLLLDQELKSLLVPATVEYLLYFPLFLFIYYNWQRWRVWFLSWDQVYQSSRELHYIKHGMVFLHCIW